MSRIAAKDARSIRNREPLPAYSSEKEQYTFGGGGTKRNGRNSQIRFQIREMAAEMTAIEQTHFENVKRLWKEDGVQSNWTLESDDYRCKVRKGNFQWFEFRLRHGWQFVPKEQIIEQM